MAYKREWLISEDQYETVEDFQAAVQYELANLEVLGRRLGSAFVVTPIRVEEERSYVGGTVKDYPTVAWHFRGEMVPAGKRKRSNGTPEPEPDEDMIAMVGPGGEERKVPESEVSDLMEQGWRPDVEEDDPDAERLDGEPETEIPEPAAVGKDPYAE